MGAIGDDRIDALISGGVAVGTTTGRKPVSAVRPTCRRQVKTRLVLTLYCRPITETDAPGTDAAATISRFSASGQTFRRTLFLVSIISLVDTIPATSTLNGREPAVGCYHPTRRPSA